MSDKTDQAKKISDNIKRLRMGLDWNQARLAQEASISGAALSKIEQGSDRIPTIVVVRKLASALGVEISEITGEQLEAPSEAQERNKEFYRQWGVLDNLSKEDQDRLKDMATRLKEIS
jgi:transcriptional regulator with XRE-family HTH domain